MRNRIGSGLCVFAAGLCFGATHIRHGAGTGAGFVINADTDTLKLSAFSGTVIRLD